MNLIVMYLIVGACVIGAFNVNAVSGIALLFVSVWFSLGKILKIT